MRIALWRFPLTTPMRMIDRVHHNSTRLWSDAKPPRPACFSETDILVVNISNVPNGCIAIHREVSDFSGWKLHLGDLSLFCHQLD
jgi:hypothetical protein